LARFDAWVRAAGLAVTTTSVFAGALLVAVEWLYRQLAGRNVLHDLLEPSGWIMAMAAVAALVVGASWRVGERAADRWASVVAYAVLAITLAASLAGLDWSAAKSHFHPSWSLVWVAGAMAVALTLAALRAFYARILRARSP